MNRFFVDSSAFIALAKINDENHERARDFFENLSPPFQGITSDYILDETATRLRDSLGAEKAVLFCEKVLESRLYKVLFVDRSILKSALDKMKKYGDKPLSFTDCTSFVLMEKHHLRSALTFDTDFRNVGFEMLPY